MLDILQFTHYWVFAFLLLGGFVGFIAGLLGAGGGAIMVPMLTTFFLLMGIDTSKIVHLALGTSMTAIVLTSFASVRAHHRHGAIYWHLVRRIGPGTFIGTVLAVLLVGNFNPKILSLFFTVFVLIISYRLYQSTLSTDSESKNELFRDPEKSQKNVQACFPTGIFIGVISAIVSIGGGSLTVPYLTHFDISIRHAIATSSAIGFIISVSGTSMYFLLSLSSSQDFSSVPGSLGYVFLPAALCIGLVSLFTAKFGAAMAHRLPDRKLKRTFSILLILLSINMLIAVFS